MIETIEQLKERAISDGVLSETKYQLTSNPRRNIYRLVAINSSGVVTQTIYISWEMFEKIDAVWEHSLVNPNSSMTLVEILQRLLGSDLHRDIIQLAREEYKVKKLIFRRKIQKDRIHRILDELDAAVRDASDLVLPAYYIEVLRKYVEEV